MALLEDLLLEFATQDISAEIRGGAESFVQFVRQNLDQDPVVAITPDNGDVRLIRKSRKIQMLGLGTKAGSGVRNPPATSVAGYLHMYDKGVESSFATPVFPPAK